MLPKLKTLVEIELPKLLLPTFNSKKRSGFHSRICFEVNNERFIWCTKTSIFKKFPICDDNFEIAWELLSQKYSHRRELMSSLIKQVVTHILFEYGKYSPYSKNKNKEIITINRLCQ